MGARDHQRVAKKLKGASKPSVPACPHRQRFASRALLASLPSSVLAFSFFILGFNGAVAFAQPAGVMVSPSEQATHDDERLRILREELHKTQARAQVLAQRRAERIAMADPVGAGEANEERIRVLSDIAGLQREIAATHPLAAVLKASPPARSPFSAAQVAQPKSHIPAQPIAPWWDVYGRARHVEIPTPTSAAQPPGLNGAAGAPIDPTRRME